MRRFRPRKMPPEGICGKPYTDQVRLKRNFRLGCQMERAIGFRSFVNWLHPEFFLSDATKLALLWFDELVIEGPEPDFWRGVVNSHVAEGRLSKAAGDELLRVTKPIQAYIPDYDAKRQFERPDSSSVFELLLDETIHNLLDQEYLREYGELFYDTFQHVGDIRPFITFNAFRYWRLLAERLNCSFVPGPFESEVLESLPALGESKKQHFVFEQIMRCRLPRLSSLSFDDICDLRKHRYLSALRRKVSEVSEMARSGDREDAKTLFQELEHSAMRKVLEVIRPNTRTTLIKAVLTNIPLPIPVNPLGVSQGILDVHKDYKLERHHGWLYFLLDAETRTADRKDDVRD